MPVRLSQQEQSQEQEQQQGISLRPHPSEPATPRCGVFTDTPNGSMIEERFRSRVPVARVLLQERARPNTAMPRPGQ